MGDSLGRLILPPWFALILVTITSALSFAAFIWQAFWAAALTLGVAVASLVFWFYSTQHRKRSVQYPLVPPDGKADVYFPRARIPRPIHEDFRDMDERKRKLNKLRKMTRQRD